MVNYNNSSRLDSGLVTVFTNRLGDCLFIVRFIFMFYCGWFSFEYLTLRSRILFFVIFVFGCITKSAQMPFSSWLPAAMAAPTPVSSLVHSSTLVTAGVYLLLRFNYIFRGFNFLVVISLFTIFVAGGCAVYEMDFKKVVAMSTLRQLGFIIFSVRLGYWVLGFLHIIFHAFFKSSLFLSTGNLIHFYLGNQDSRYFGSLNNSYFAKLFFCIRGLSLIGFPFSLGFYSKDTILASFLFSLDSLVVYVFCLSCCFTVSYSLRLVYIGFQGFSSFPSSLGFSENVFFFVPVFFLYFYCVYLGNFFLYNFILPLYVRFLDCFLGICIILGGLLFFVFGHIGYFLNFSFSKMFYLYILSPFLGVFRLNTSYYSNESTWMELYFSKGGLLVFNFFSEYGFGLLLMKFSYFLILCTIFFTLWM